MKHLQQVTLKKSLNRLYYHFDNVCLYMLITFFRSLSNPPLIPSFLQTRTNRSLYNTTSTSLFFPLSV